MLIVVIAAGELIIDERFMMYLIAGASPVPRAQADRVEDADDDLNGAGLEPFGRVDSSTKVVVESKIVEALTGVGTSDAEEVLPGALLDEVENTEDTTNGADTNKVVTTRGSEGKVGV